MEKRGAELAGSKRRFCSRDDRTRSANPRGFGRLPAVVLALFLVVSTSLALDPRQSLSRFRLVRWDEDQGLPENYTSNIAQTRDGFMWLAFDHGLIRFDGKNFAAGEGLHANLGLPTKVFGLVPGRSGELWIGSYKALFCRSANGEFKRFDHIDGLPDDYLSALFQDSEGTLWIGTDHSGLLQLKQGRFLTYPGSLQLAESYIYAMCETSQAFWVGTATGFIKLIKLRAGSRSSPIRTVCLETKSTASPPIGTGEFGPGLEKG
jgi:ligand-binding sensor domain-containing protein